MIEALGPISYYENKDMTQSNIATYSLWEYLCIVP